MVASLLLGCLFAIGHHLFYQSLAGKLVTADSYNILGSNITSQQVNTAAGTAFAFLVRACLVFSVSLAYLQAVWNAAKGTRRPMTLANIDALLSALSNALALTNVFAWWKWPLLLLVALIAWLIPIASIITPATLSVGVDSPPPRLLQVPNVAFTSLSLVADMHNNPNNGMGSTCTNDFSGYNCTQTINYVYNGPSDAVKRVVTATAAQGAIVALVAPALNSSWTLKFLGPSIKCSAVDDETRSQFENSIANFTLSGQNCGLAPGYLAWTPQMSTDTDISGTLPFILAENDTYTFNTGLATDRQYGDIATLFVAAIPSVMELLTSRDSDTGPSACEIQSSNSTYQQKVSSLFGSNTAMLRCDLYNSTYQADFDFVNGNQHVQVTISDLEATPIQTVPQVEALYVESPSQQRCDILTISGVSECSFDPSLLRTLSYQAVMDAFTQLLGGMVFWTQNSNYGFTFDSNTSITSTALTESLDLAFLANPASLTDTGSWPSLQETQPTWNNSLYLGLSNTPTSGANVSLQDALETLFQNITISLMSSASLQPNISSAFFPPPTNVTFSTYQNIYVYAHDKLWLAYGLAISASTLIVIFGLVAIFINRASYSYSFSSVLRLSRGAEISIEIDKSDLDGRDPLPQYLEQSLVRFPNIATSPAQSTVIYTPVPDSGATQ